MTRLIDADDFFRTFPELAIEPYINAPTVSKKELQKIFYETAEKPELKEVLAYECGKASERPQGEWMKIEAPSYTIIRCTCCGYKDNAIYIPNFCPNCGADMREDGKQ